MPKGQKEDRIMAESKKFSANRNNYPYQRYIYWRPVEEGNILFNDEKFAMIIYRQHNEEFSDISKVTDASDVIKTDIYDFIQNGEKVMIVVDCENSDPIKLASTLTQLNADELSKISKIELYDDKHTSKAWKYIGTLTGIPVEHNVIERVKEENLWLILKCQWVSQRLISVTMWIHLLCFQVTQTFGVLSPQFLMQSFLLWLNKVSVDLIF